MKVLDENAERIVNYILVSPAYKIPNFPTNPTWSHMPPFARRARQEGMVLLKNETSALPLATDAKNWPYSDTYEFISGGTGSGDVKRSLYRVAGGRFVESRLPAR